MAFDPLQFPKDTEEQRVSTLDKYNDLYENRQKNALPLHKRLKKHFSNPADIIYLSHAIPAMISDTYGDFVQGDVEQMTIEGAEDGNQDFVDDIATRNKLKERVYNFAVCQSEFGFTVLHVHADNEDEEVMIDKIGEDQYFPQPDGSVVIATYKRHEEWRQDSPQFYVLLEHFTETGKNVDVKRYIGETGPDGKMTELHNFDSSKVLFNESLKEEDTLDIDELPFIRINNGPIRSHGFAKSDYNDIIPQLAEINERASHVSIQLLKNLDSKLILPDTQAFKDEEGNVKTDIGDTLLLPENGKDPSYLANGNTLLQDVRDHIMYNLKIISGVTGVPFMEILRDSMPDRVEAIRTKHFRTQMKTRTKQSQIANGIRDAIRIAAKLDDQGDDIANAGVTISFSSILPEDETSIVEREQMKVSAGLSSRLSAIKRIGNLNDEQAEQELGRIREEERIEGVSDTTNPPQV